MSDMSTEFDLGGDLVEGHFAIEASAGTGKTFSLTGLVARHVAEKGVRADQLLMVTFTRAASSDMRDRTRRQCRALLTALEAHGPERDLLVTGTWMEGCLSPSEDENRLRAARLRSFLARYDEATITTIHGFCQIVLQRAGLLSPLLHDPTFVGDSTELIAQVVADVLIGPVSGDPGLLGDTDIKVTSVIDAFASTVKAVAANPSAIRIPSVPSGAVSMTELEPHDRWARLVDEVLETIRRRRQSARIFGYDDLVTSVEEILGDSVGPRLVSSLRDQYRLVLIDEFQDTDTGQWNIFKRTFVEPAESGRDISVGMVGDPKQAIYRFRGADIDAYRSAVHSVPHHVELRTNYRSDERLISAVNALFAGATFGNESIVYRDVRSRADTEGHGLIGHAPVEVRWVPYSSWSGSRLRSGRLTKQDKLLLAEGRLDRWTQATDRSMELIYGDMATTIRDLLDSGTLVDKTGTPRAVRPRDIAVLVRSHSHGDRIREVFDTAGIPSVRYRARSVFNSPAVQQWGIFLAALASPSRADRVRAASLSVFGTGTIEDLVTNQTVSIEMFQSRCADLAGDLIRHGLATLYFRERSRSSFMERVMSQPEGDRLLTDLDHIAEALSLRLDGSLGVPAADVVQLLEELSADSSDAEDLQRRIETDAEAVQIATIHHSKGLEYPIVFLPTAMKMVAATDEVPFVFSSGARRVIDVASPVEWTWPDSPQSTRSDRKSAALDDVTGDLMRLLYVAMTRAEHNVILYWSPVKSSATSSLGRLLFGRDEHGSLVIDPASCVPRAVALTDSNAVMAERLDTVANLSSNIRVSRLDPTTIEPSDVDATPIDRRSVEVARFTRRVPVRRPAWRKWSYSALSARLGTTHGALAEPFVPGADEGVHRVVEATETVVEPEQIVLYPDSLAGADFGTRIHEILEAVDPTSAQVGESIRREVEARFSRRVSDETVDEMTRAIEATLRTPVGPALDGRDLSGIDTSDRLCEMTFDMRIPDAPVTLERIGELMLNHLSPDDPLRAYASRLLDRSRPIVLAGFLYGEIDALVRIRRPDGNWKVVVVDYKSNLLHASGERRPLDAYRRDELARVMAEDHYVLQALIYLVAVHRYMSWRVPEYRAEEHLGGAAYLFVRGMVGVDSPCDESGTPSGVYWWTPPESLIVALDLELRP